MPSDCVHNVNFDNLEFERTSKGSRSARHRISTFCTKCDERVTLDQVIEKMIEHIMALSDRVRQLELKGEVVKPDETTETEEPKETDNG
jgi:hypothetical protein